MVFHGQKHHISLPDTLTEKYLEFLPWVLARDIFWARDIFDRLLSGPINTIKRTLSLGIKTVELNSAKPRSIRTLEDTQIKKRMVFNVFIVVSKHFNLEI